jgi:deoxycytidine triphosphate deaminase
MPYADLRLPTGFLTDRAIRRALNEGYLITRGTWSEGSIRHASYTLRIGARIEVADFARANVEDRRIFVRHDLHAGEHIDVRPGDTAKLYAIEILDLPNEVLAFSVARGLFFFEALLPENTYADPGFNGDFYITVTNLSHRVVRLQYEAPIARLFFYQLAEAIEEPFRQGAARGIPQRLESFRATQLGTAEQCRAANETALMDDLTRSSVAGPQEAELLRRLAHRNRALIVLTVVWPMLLVLANLNSTVKDALGWVWSNLLAIVASTVLTLAFTWLWEKIKRL